MSIPRIKPEQPRVIPTSRSGLELRELWTPEDDTAYHEAVLASGDHLAQHGDTTAEEYQDVAAVTASRERAMGTKILRCGIWDNDEFVGSVNMRPGTHGVEMGSWVRADATGKGYATEARRAIMRYALDHKEPDQTVFGRIHVDNTASIIASLKAGYVRVGTNGDFAYFMPREEQPEVVEFGYPGRLTHATDRYKMSEDGELIDVLDSALRHGLQIRNKATTPMPRAQILHMGEGLTHDDVLFTTQLQRGGAQSARPRFDEINFALSPSVRGYEYDELPANSFARPYNEHYVLENVRPDQIDAIALPHEMIGPVLDEYAEILVANNIAICDYASNAYWSNDIS